MRSARFILLSATLSCACAPAPVGVPFSANDGSSLRSLVDAAPAQISPFARLYPVTRVTDATDVLFGTAVEDPYRWLEDGSSQEVTGWLKQQDDLARSKLLGLPDRASFVARLTELLYVEGIGSPRKRGNRYFTWKRGANQEKWMLSWKEGKNGVERTLLDPNTWTADGSLALVDAFASLDGGKVAYRVSLNNGDETTTRVVDVLTGKRSDKDTIDGTQYGTISWSAKGDGFYYRFTPKNSSVPASDRMGLAELRFHKLGDDPKSDRVVHPRTGNTKAFLSGFASPDGHWLFAEIWHGWSANDLYFQDLRRKPGVWVPVVVGKPSQ